MFTSQTRARSLNTRLALQTTVKGTMSVSEYFGKMKALADEVAATGKRLDEEDFIAYILNGLDGEFDSVVSAIGMKTEPISVMEVYSQVLNFENRLKLRQEGTASAHAASRGRGGFNPRAGGFSGGGGGGPGRGRGAPTGGANFPGGNGGGGNSRGRGYTPARNRGNQQRVDPRPICQVCYKRGHVAAKCWHRFDENYVPDERHVAAAAQAAYAVDTNWYIDSGATDHITSELDKLTVREKYKGTEKIHTANGVGMQIKHIGHALVHTPDNHTLHLKNVLHVPHATKNLISASRLAEDNYVFLEIHSKYFLVKDRATRNIILKGRCRKGLYPYPSEDAKYVCSVAPSFARWHSRLSHPTTPIVSRVVNQNKLPCQKSHSESVCDACQKAKSHQLPYSRSTSVSTRPLELVYSDVWGPAPSSVGGNKLYVSFIDDFSKFTWVYSLKHKSDVFQKFHEFQALVERLLGHKIITMQKDWGREYQKLHSFFDKIGISHHVSCPHAHQQNGSAERKHRHIVEVGLALLAHASMPLKF